MNVKRGWTMQLHIGTLRNNNSAMYKRLGPDTGFDSMDDGQVGRPLALFLGGLLSKNELPKTVYLRTEPAGPHAHWKSHSLFSRLRHSWKNPIRFRLPVQRSGRWNGKTAYRSSTFAYCEISSKSSMKRLPYSRKLV